LRFIEHAEASSELGDDKESVVAMVVVGEGEGEGEGLTLCEIILA